MMRSALVVTCTVVCACATPAPRGAVAVTSAAAGPKLASCADASAPYLAELCGMHEPSLSIAGPETYRFVWTSPPRNPVAVRLSRAGETAIAVVAIEGDERNPAAQRRHEFTVPNAVWIGLRKHLDAADFWNLAGDPADDERGLDGADWALEGRRGGVYHSVIRWEPRPGPFRTACEDLIKVSGISFPAEIR
ncbi:MAG TPA: hypothetical protein VK989_18310 [Polyangia bacterium]|jgi:hypothetical protein|nr:hypothetical protein [Polyangia bacterium]